MDALQHHAWPGNVRELENVVERAMIASTGDTLQLDEPLRFNRPGAMPAGASDNLDAVQRLHIETVLQRCGWRINGPGNAAERLGIHPNTLRFRMKKLGVVGPASGPGTTPRRWARVGLPRRPPRALACAAPRWRCVGRAGRRVELQLDVPGRPDQRRAFRATRCSASMPAMSADTRSVRSSSRDRAVGAGREQFRHVRDAEPAGQTHDAPIAFRHHPDPTLHGILPDARNWRHSPIPRARRPLLTDESVSLLDHALERRPGSPMTTSHRTIARIGPPGADELCDGSNVISRFGRPSTPRPRVSRRML